MTEQQKNGGYNNYNRNFWQENEIRTLLGIVMEHHIIKLFDGKKYRNHEIYKRIHEEMEKNGVTNKSVEQIKNKWKALKSAYNTTKRNNQSVLQSQRVLCDFYNELDEILGGRSSMDCHSQESQDGDTKSENIKIQDLVKAENIEILVDPDPSRIEIKQYQYQSSEDNLSDEEDAPQKTAEIPRKRKLDEVTSGTKTKCLTKDKDMEQFFKLQRELMAEFFDRQREAEKVAAKERAANLTQILTEFTKSMQTLASQQVQVPYIMMPYKPEPGTSGLQNGKRLRQDSDRNNEDKSDTNL